MVSHILLTSLLSEFLLLKSIPWGTPGFAYRTYASTESSSISFLFPPSKGFVLAAFSTVEPLFSPSSLDMSTLFRKIPVKVNTICIVTHFLNISSTNQATCMDFHFNPSSHLIFCSSAEWFVNEATKFFVSISLVKWGMEMFHKEPGCWKLRKPCRRRIKQKSMVAPDR